MSPFKHGLKWGLVAGAVMAALGALFNLVRAYEWGPVSSLLGLVFLALLFLLIFLAMRSFTKSEGSRSYGQGALIGLVALVVAGLVSAASTFAWQSFVSDELIESQRAQAEAQAAGQDIPPEQAEMQAKIFEAIFSPAGFALIGFLQTCFFGVPAVLIMAAFGRGQPAPSPHVA